MAKLEPSATASSACCAPAPFGVSGIAPVDTDSVTRVETSPSYRASGTLRRTSASFSSSPGRAGTTTELSPTPHLYDAVTGGQVVRTGVWGGTNGTLWPHYPQMKRQVDQASDHAGIYADLDI